MNHTGCNFLMYDNFLSNANDVLTRVPQGSILGPLLLIIFLNDITDVISSAKIIKYVDDTVIYVADKDVKVIKSSFPQVLMSLQTG